jgi:hypothetical protein
MPKARVTALSWRAVNVSVSTPAAFRLVEREFVEELLHAGARKPFEMVPRRAKRSGEVEASRELAGQGAAEVGVVLIAPGDARQELPGELGLGST